MNINTIIQKWELRKIVFSVVNTSQGNNTFLAQYYSISIWRLYRAFLLHNRQLANMCFPLLDLFLYNMLNFIIESSLYSCVRVKLHIIWDVPRLNLLNYCYCLRFSNFLLLNMYRSATCTISICDVKVCGTMQWVEELMRPANALDIIRLDVTSHVRVY